MCDYSLEGYASREAEVGDKLIVSRHIRHGFMRVEDATKLDAVRTRENVCMTCLKEEGIVLNLCLNGMDYEGVRYVRYHSGGFRDALTVPGCNSPFMLASLPTGTTATVVSIPSVTAAKAKEQTLDEKLGLDGIKAEVTQEAEPSAVVAAYRRVVAAVVG